MGQFLSVMYGIKKPRQAEREELYSLIPLPRKDKFVPSKFIKPYHDANYPNVQESEVALKLELDAVKMFLRSKDEEVEELKKTNKDLLAENSRLCRYNKQILQEMKKIEKEMEKQGTMIKKVHNLTGA